MIINLSGSHNHENKVSLTGIFLIFLAVCSEALYTLFSKKISQEVNALVLTFLTAVISLILFIVPSVFEIKNLQIEKISVDAWLALLWWGVGGMGLASILWFDGVKKVSGSIAAGFMGVMSISALVLSYIVLSEGFMWVHIAGFIIVFTGVILVSISHAEEMH
ncbi:MAG TPA: DMT family transporter [Ignavibacteria bacterium]